MIYDIEYDENKMLPLKEIQLKSGTILRVTQDDGDDVDIILEAM
jgi:ubiquitin-like 1-activating enzyme E1 B